MISRIIVLVLSMGLVTVAAADDSRTAKAADTSANTQVDSQAASDNDAAAVRAEKRGRLVAALSARPNSANANADVSGTSHENHMGIGFAHGSGSRIGPVSNSGGPVVVSSPVGGVVVGGGNQSDNNVGPAIRPPFPGPQPCPTFNRDLGGGDCDPSPSK